MDLNAIYWKFLNNMRLFNLQMFIKHLYDEETKNGENVQFRIFSDFSETSPLRNIREILISMKMDYPMKIVDGYSQAEKRNLTDIALINSLYQSFIEQESSYAENEYVFVVTDTKYINTLDYLQSKSGRSISIYVANDFPYIRQLDGMFEIHGDINVSASTRSVFDKTIIRQIFEMIDSAKEKGINLTLKNLSDDCLRLSKIKHEDTLYMVKALMIGGYLKKEEIELENGSKYLSVEVADQQKVDELLSSM